MHVCSSVTHAGDYRGVCACAAQHSGMHNVPDCLNYVQEYSTPVPPAVVGSLVSVWRPCAGCSLLVRERAAQLTEALADGADESASDAAWSAGPAPALTCAVRD